MQIPLVEYARMVWLARWLYLVAEFVEVTAKCRITKKLIHLLTDSGFPNPSEVHILEIIKKKQSATL